MRGRFTLWFAALNSPQSYAMFVQSLLVLFGTAGLWILCAILLSQLGGWFTILMTTVLLVVVGIRSYRLKRRQMWIARGYCANCGYDLRTTPDQCPECGRNAALDEPPWRKIRRQREAALKQIALGAPAAMPIPTVEQVRARLTSPPST